MSLSRKRKKQLKRLRGSAEELWQEQSHVLERASAVAREASKQVGLLTKEEVVPKVMTTYDARLRPSVDKGYAAAKAGYLGTKAKVTVDVVPAVTGAIASAVAALDLAKDHRLRKALETFSAKLPVAVAPAKKGPGVGTYALVGLGVLAVAGAAYAAWQTFRADDELWVADDEPTVTGTTNPTDVPPTPTA